MGLKEVLSKMKLVEAEPRPGPASPASAGIPANPARPSASPPAREGGRPTAAPASVREILAGLPAPQIDERALPGYGGGPAGRPDQGAQGAHAADAAAELPDFDSIYRAAGIADPPHGYTAYKVLEILSSESFSGLDARSRAAALAGFLKMNPGGPVPIADVIQDAVRRDQALDKFEELLRGKLAARAQEMERENAALQAEIDELARKNRERMETNRRALEAEQARLGQWQARKRIEERKLFEAAGPFVEENPVSVEPSPAPQGPPEGAATPGA